MKHLLDQIRDALVLIPLPHYYHALHQVQDALACPACRPLAQAHIALRDLYEEIERDDADRQDLIDALAHVSRMLVTAADDLKKKGMTVNVDTYRNAAKYGQAVAERSR